MKESEQMDTRVFDLHCDTLSVMREDPALSFESMPRHLDLRKMKQGNYLLQCMACFVDLGEGRVPLVDCLEMIDIFYRLLETYPEDLMQVRSGADLDVLEKSGRIGLMLTVEEGAACMDSPAVLRTLYRLGVRMMTLTWNYENGLAFPNNPADRERRGAAERGLGPETERGLTERGFLFVEEMERLHMLVDVSHLSDKGIWDVAGISRRPFAASHSNARSVCGHVRNLTDEMIRMMGEKGCLIGLNYCPEFVTDKRDGGESVSRIEYLAAHAKHIINTGGEDILALGSDFDGIEGELEITDASRMPKLGDGLLQAGLTARQVEKIYCGNALRFFRENL